MTRARDPFDQEGILSLRRLGPAPAALLLAALGLLLLWGLAAALAHHGPGQSAGAGDARLYAALVSKVHDGAGYYSAAPEELRRGGYPLRPFIAVRPPLLTVALAKLPDEAWRHGALLALAGVAWLAWARRFRLAYHQEPIRFAWAIVLLTSGVGVVLGRGAYLFHETWAGLLIALSLAVRGPRWWVLSLGLGLLACLIRELAFPYLAVMALFAWREGRLREAAAWCGALGLATAALAGHAFAVIAVTHAGDPASPGWAGFGGYPFLLRLSQWNLLLSGMPLWSAALLLAPALLGLLFWTGAGAGRGARTGFAVLGYGLAFCIVGRPDNDYWGLMIASLWPLGLIEADRAITGLLARCRGLVARPPAADLA